MWLKRACWNQVGGIRCALLSQPKSVSIQVEETIACVSEYPHRWPTWIPSDFHRKINTASENELKRSYSLLKYLPRVVYIHAHFHCFSLLAPDLNPKWRSWLDRFVHTKCCYKKEQEFDHSRSMLFLLRSRNRQKRDQKKNFFSTKENWWKGRGSKRFLLR